MGEGGGEGEKAGTSRQVPLSLTLSPPKIALMYMDVRNAGVDWIIHPPALPAFPPSMAVTRGERIVQQILPLAYCTTTRTSLMFCNSVRFAGAMSPSRCPFTLSLTM